MRVKANDNYVGKIKTDEKPVYLSIKVGTSVNNTLIISAFDDEINNTFLFSREARPGNDKTYFFGVPKTGKFLNILIYSTSAEYDFDVKKIIVEPIENFKSMNLVVDETTKKFQDFIRQFSFLYGGIKEDSVVDKDRLFKIILLDEIADTPIRIGEVTNNIQISRRAFNSATVSQRSLMLCHEYSHNYLNKDPDSEFEADKNGLKVYLSMKYPVIEAYNTFLSLTPNMFSYERLVAAEKFLTQYNNKLLFEHE